MKRRGRGVSESWGHVGAPVEEGGLTPSGMFHTSSPGAPRLCLDQGFSALALLTFGVRLSPLIGLSCACLEVPRFLPTSASSSSHPLSQWWQWKPSLVIAQCPRVRGEGWTKAPSLESHWRIYYTILTQTLLISIIYWAFTSINLKFPCSYYKEGF